MQRCLFLLAIPRGDMEVSYFYFYYLQRVYCSCCKRTNAQHSRGGSRISGKGVICINVCGGGGGEGVAFLILSHFFLNIP